MSPTPSGFSNTEGRAEGALDCCFKTELRDSVGNTCSLKIHPPPSQGLALTPPSHLAPAPASQRLPPALPHPASLFEGTPPWPLPFLRCFLALPSDHASSVPTPTPTPVPCALSLGLVSFASLFTAKPPPHVHLLCWASALLSHSSRTTSWLPASLRWGVGSSPGGLWGSAHRPMRCPVSPFLTFPSRWPARSAVHS